MTPTPESIAAVDTAITSRRSLRAFLPTPVPRQVIEDILAVAARAPSGTNTQPWKVHVLTGEAKAALTRDILAAFDDPVERIILGVVGETVFGDAVLGKIVGPDFFAPVAATYL